MRWLFPSHFLEFNMSKTIKARVLVQCAYGLPDQVAEVPEDEASALEAAGKIDTNKVAVAFAEKEAKAKAKAQPEE